MKSPTDPLYNDDESDIISEINMAPVADIVFVLLIVFMVTSSYLLQPAIQVDLPKALTAEETPQSTLSLVLTRQGDLYLNGKQTDEQTLAMFVKEARTREGDALQAIISADRAATHGDVVHLIDLIQSLGVVRFALNTSYDGADQTPKKGGHAPPTQEL